MEDVVGAPEFGGSVSIARQDSGYGENPVGPKVGRSQQEMAFESPSLHGGQSIETASTSPERWLNRSQNFSRHSSTHPTFRRESDSRRSSFIVNNPANRHNKKPHRTNRGFSNIHERHVAEDPFLAHQRSLRVFPPVESLDDIKLAARTAPQRRVTSPNLPKSPHTLISKPKDLGSQKVDTLPQYTNFFPAANTDWTLPSTRLREYEKIDRSCHGVRGLWRRYAPHWCRRNSRLGFFEEDRGDTSSVRRYRMDLSKCQSDIKITSVEKDAMPPKSRIRRTWGHFSSKPWSPD